MKASSNIASAIPLIAAVAVIYVAGYIAIRMGCTGSAPLFVVPSRNDEHADALITLYKPLFYAERKLTGHHFSVSASGEDVGF